VVALNPVEGLQLYVLAPDAVSVVLPPWQAVGGLAVTVTLGKGKTVSVSVEVFVQPFASVVVTVYVVVAVGNAVGFAAVVLLNPVEGVHE
jgi:hypothetical protein